MDSNTTRAVEKEPTATTAPPSFSPSTSPWVVCTIEIDVILRDSHGIAQVKSVTGSKILRVLQGHGLVPEVPKDLYHLIKKVVAIRKHMERTRK